MTDGDRSLATVEMAPIIVDKLDDGFECPEVSCIKVYATVASLQRHCQRRHGGLQVFGRIDPIPVETIREQKRKYDKAYCERNSKRARTAKSLHPREPYDMDDADTRGVFKSDLDALVEYRPSLIPNAGNGVFAKVELRKGDIITWFAGELAFEAATDSTYTIRIGDCYLNGISEPKQGEGLGSFINREERGDRATCKNCEFVCFGVGSHPVYVEVTKDIPAGYELYTTYGRGYRIDK